MPNPILGHVKCPMCSNQNATVHEQNKGKAKQKKYIRCYTPDGGGCGTLQCTGPDGQAYIDQNWRPLNMPKPDNLAETVEPTPEADQVSGVLGHGTLEAENETKSKPKRGLMGLLVSDDEDEAA